MKNTEAMPTTTISRTKNTRALESETRELETLHTGLVRHLTAWRGAHDAATAHLKDMLARIDALTARIERAAP